MSCPTCGRRRTCPTCRARTNPQTPPVPPPSPATTTAATPEPPPAAETAGPAAPADRDRGHPGEQWILDRAPTPPDPVPDPEPGTPHGTPNRETARKVVGYARVSTNGQAEHGYGLDLQTAAITGWARDNGYHLITTYRDEGVSGASELEHRDGLVSAMAHLHDPEVDGIVVARVDRLARDLIVQEQLLAEVRRVGGRVWSCVPGEDHYLDDDTDDPSRRFIRQVLGAVAEYERAMISTRLKAGLRRRIAETGWGGGEPPWGFEVVDGILQVRPECRDMLAYGKRLERQGKSRRAIAAAFAERGWLRNGKRWHHEQVKRFLAAGDRAKG